MNGGKGTMGEPPTKRRKVTRIAPKQLNRKSHVSTSMMIGANNIGCNRNNNYYSNENNGNLAIYSHNNDNLGFYLNESDNNGIMEPQVCYFKYFK